MRESVRALLGHPGIWLGNGQGTAPDGTVLSTGFPALDALLPGGGWPAGAVTELLSDAEGIGELRLVMPSLAECAGSGRRIAWIDPPHLPYAPALAAAGVRPSRVLLVRAGAGRDRLWAAEQCLRSGACGAVLSWPGDCDDRALRRLQLAAEKGGAMGLLFRPERFASSPSPATLRLRIAPAPAGVAVCVLKGRCGTGRRADIPLPAPYDTERSSHALAVHPSSALFR